MKKTLLIKMVIILIIAILPLNRVFATKHVISVQNFTFSPASITDVIVGDTMRWVWVSGSHTTTSTTIPASAPSWDHPINSSNTSFEYIVTIAGSYNYKCTPHASMGMVGSFIATAPAPTLAVLPANQDVPAIAGSTTFTVTSNSSWTASSDMTWCTVTPSGTNDGSITATYLANPTNAIRVAMITIVVSGLDPLMVTVTQDLSSVSVNEIPGNTFRIFPNPTKGKFEVSLGNISNRPVEITVLDAIGTLVFSQWSDGTQNCSIDLAAFARGSYFVRVETNEEVKVGKLLLIK